MSDELNSTSIEINSPSNGNHHHSPSKETIGSSSHIDQSVDSVLSSELEKINGGDDELNTTNHQRESSPTSGVIIPEEKRVTDRVKVFEAVANKNENKKKSSTSTSFSMADQKQVSPSSTESFDTQSMNETKTSKNKSKKSSLKKQIQNLLKIDKSVVQDDFNSVDEHINGKKNKKDNSKNV
jgi:hypothetical protein